MFSTRTVLIVALYVFSFVVFVGVTTAKTTMNVAATAIGIIITNQSLVLQKVRRESRGHYQCVASNSEGEAESDKILLRIHYAPVCRKKQNLIYGVARDEDAEIPCHVSIM